MWLPARRKNNISVIDSALRPGAPYLPNVQRNLAMALALGLAVGVGLALMLEFLDTTIRRTEDVGKAGRPSGTGTDSDGQAARTAAEKPRWGRKPTSGAVSHYSEIHPKSAVSEAFRSLRTSLMFSGPPQGMPKTILVTQPGTGRRQDHQRDQPGHGDGPERVAGIDHRCRFAQAPDCTAILRGIPHSPGLTNRIAGVTV